MLTGMNYHLVAQRLQRRADNGRFYKLRARATIVRIFNRVSSPQPILTSFDSMSSVEKESPSYFTGIPVFWLL